MRELPRRDEKDALSDSVARKYLTRATEISRRRANT